MGRDVVGVPADLDGDDVIPDHVRRTVEVVSDIRDESTVRGVVPQVGVRLKVGLDEIDGRLKSGDDRLCDEIGVGVGHRLTYWLRARS
jgi:hypothetical protein